jgi:histidinol-phosphate aminotransferase
MSNPVLSSINKGIAELHPYQPGKPIDEVVAEYNPAKVVKLASNENPLGPSPKAKEALTSLESLCIYILMEMPRA